MNTVDLADCRVQFPSRSSWATACSTSRRGMLATRGHCLNKLSENAREVVLARF